MSWLCPIFPSHPYLISSMYLACHWFVSSMSWLYLQLCSLPIPMSSLVYTLLVIGLSLVMFWLCPMFPSHLSLISSLYLVCHWFVTAMFWLCLMFPSHLYLISGLYLACHWFVLAMFWLCPIFPSHLYLISSLYLICNWYVLAMIVLIVSYVPFPSLSDI